MLRLTILLDKDGIGRCVECPLNAWEHLSLPTAKKALAHLRQHQARLGEKFSPEFVARVEKAAAGEVA